jgi:hypothetical protein
VHLYIFRFAHLDFIFIHNLAVIEKISGFCPRNFYASRNIAVKEKLSNPQLNPQLNSCIPETNNCLFCGIITRNRVKLYRYICLLETLVKGGVMRLWDRKN